MVEGIDTAAIEAKIAKYQEENAEQIINARARKVLREVSKVAFISFLCRLGFLRLFTTKNKNKKKAIPCSFYFYCM